MPRAVAPRRPVTHTIYFVAPWDLNRALACVPDDPSEGSVLLVESRAKGRQLPWHAKKLVLVLSAMHHFAEELRGAGFEVSVRNARTYVEAIREEVRARGARRVVALRPRERGLERSLCQAAAEGSLGAELVLHDDGGEGGHFLLTRAEFAGWAAQQSTSRSGQRYRMERFYAWMRARTGWLMEDGRPVGGRLSLDQENRKTPKKDTRPPAPRRFPPDAITRAQMERVAAFPHVWGEVDGFDWPVCRADALAALDDFFAGRHAGFGDYQDAMLRDEPYLWHGLLSPAMNLSLLHPREVLEQALAAYAAGEMPLNATEGFVRQILGWREFVRGVYQERVDSLRDANGLAAKRHLPQFFWEPEQVDAECLRQSAAQVWRTGYGHHIQRLMVLSNFALLAGVIPQEVSHWFWAGFVDAYEWVELPNVMGMGLYADPIMTTKPYAAGANYLNKMSDYCRACPYDPKARTGEDACPFNALFWSFVGRHPALFEKNGRLAGLIRTWRGWEEGEGAAIEARATRWLAAQPSAAPLSVDPDGY